MSAKVLKSFIREAIKGKVSASPSYMKKEAVREKLQSIIAEAVASGEIGDQAALEQFLVDINTSMTALKMIPFEVWTKLAGVATSPVPVAKKKSK